jgi:hypothetical protein
MLPGSYFSPFAAELFDLAGDWLLILTYDCGSFKV